MSMFDTPESGTEPATEEVPAGTEAVEQPEPGTPPVDAPEGGEVQEAPAVPETYTITVDGKEQQVGLDELRSGYQRQSDYTRKSQALASERAEAAQAIAIADALRRNPEATIKALQDNLLGQAGQQEDVSDLDPEEQRLRNLDQRLATQESAAQHQAVQREMDDLSARYTDVDPQAVLDHAIRIDAPSLELAYRDMSFEASQQAKVAADAAEAKRLEAKKAASAVHTGGSASSGAVGGAAKAPSSIREAYIGAKARLAGA